MDEDLEEALALDVRRKIYNSVNRNPGLHFREVQRRTGIATGALQYHLDFLSKRHLVRVVKEGKFVRYYSVRGKQLGENQPLMGILRQDSLRKIIVFLLPKRKATNIQISKNVSLSPSTTSWHLDKLVQAGVVEKKQSGKKTYFSVPEKERIALILQYYKRSFFDEIVDNFVDAWQGFG